jgi:hypothetical protein
VIGWAAHICRSFDPVCQAVSVLTVVILKYTPKSLGAFAHGGR